MKKYRRLVLVVGLIVSFVLIVVYRHQYKELRSTLEYLNVLSVSLKPSECLTLNETVINNYKYHNLFSNPSPQWTNVGEHYVYSAFWEARENKVFAQAFGTGLATSKIDYECHVWFDHQHFLSSSTGKLSYTIDLSQNSSVGIFEFFCEIDARETKGIPYMFVFLYKKGTTDKKSFVPIFNRPSHLTNSTGICVKPDSVGYSKSELIEFINFHQVVGLTDLIVYDNGIHHGILAKLKGLEGLKSFIRSISVLQWNFPYDEPIQQKILELDCLHRTSGVLDALAILEWDHFVVPRQGNTILDMLEPVAKRKGTRVELSSQLCCMDAKNDKRSDESWPIILRKTFCKRISQSYIVTYYPSVGTSLKKQLVSSSGVVSIYRYCKNLKGKDFYVDSSPLKFIVKLISNKLIKIWKSGVLFYNLST